MYLLLHSLIQTSASIYMASAALYFAHCALVWKSWAWAKKQDAAPWWVRSNMCWKLAGDGYLPLTNGRMVTHTLIAFLPFYNSGFVATEIGYLVVDTCHRIWKKHIAFWWRREALGRTPKA